MIDLHPRDREACEALAAQDDVLRHALDVIEAPMIRTRLGNYQGMFRIIIEQQVSIASAQSILAKCEAAIPEISPQAILDLSEDALRGLGLSRPKVRYVRILATAVLSGELDFSKLRTFTDEEAVLYLTKITGIGPWSAAIYLLFCERRLDLWPKGDVALLAAWTLASGQEKPLMKDFDLQAEHYAPYRGMAAHILWTYYAVIRNKKPI